MYYSSTCTLPGKVHCLCFLPPMVCVYSVKHLDWRRQTCSGMFSKPCYLCLCVWWLIHRPHHQATSSSWSCKSLLITVSSWHRTLLNSYSASRDSWCTATLWNRIMTAQCEGMGEVGAARYEPALLPSCPSIRALRYSNCQRSTQSHQQSKG